MSSSDDYPKCPYCGFLLTGLPNPGECPGCGRSYGLSETWYEGQTRKGPDAGDVTRQWVRRTLDRWDLIAAWGILGFIIFVVLVFIFL